MKKYYVIFYPGHYAKFSIHHRSQDFISFLRENEEIKNITLITPEYVEAHNLKEYINALLFRLYRPCEFKIVNGKTIEVVLRKVAIPRKLRNQILNTFSFIVTYIFIDRFDSMILKLILRKVMSILNIKQYDVAFFASFNSRIGIFLKKFKLFNLLVYKDYDLLNNRFEMDMIKHADLVVSVGERMSLLRRAQGARQTLIVPHGVNCARFKEKALANGCLDSKKPKTLIYVGSIHPNWGLELAIKAIERLQDKWNLRLILVGPREIKYFPKLLLLIKKLKIEDKIQFFKQVTYEKLWEVLMVGDIGLAPYPPNSPARFAVPLKIKEYCLAGLPVVTTNIGETGQFVKETGIGLAASYNVEDYANAINALLADKNLYRSCSLAALKLIKKYDWNALFEMEWKKIKQTLAER